MDTKSNDTPARLEAVTKPLEWDKIACVMFGPSRGTEKPSITFLYVDNSIEKHVFEGEEDYTAKYKQIGETVDPTQFCKFLNIIFRAEALREVKCGESEERGHYLQFIFTDAFGYWCGYHTAEELGATHHNVAHALGHLQDQRANAPWTSTPQ